MLIDSNILVYAINADSPKHKAAQDFLQKQTGEDEMEVAHQNIFETLRVLTHPKFTHPMKTKEAEEAVWAIVDFCRIILPDYQTHHLALELIRKHNLRGNRIFDAYLAATALSNGINTIATDNEKDFQEFGLTIVNPFRKGMVSR